MTIDLRKSVTDAGYIAIGAGVLGFQQAQVRRRELQTSLAERSTDLRARAGDAGHYVVAHLASPRTVAASVTDQAKDTVAPAFDAIRARIEPAVEQLRGVPTQVTTSVTDQVKAVPGQVAGAIPETVKNVPSQVASAIPENVKNVPTQVAGAIPETVKNVPSTVSSAVGSGVDKVKSIRG